jgi:hypothetical protein
MICVVSSATGKAEVLEPGLSQGRRAGSDGELTALAIGTVGKARDVVVVGAGFASGVVKIVARASPFGAGRCPGDDSGWSICAQCADCRPSCVWNCGSARDEWV